MTENTLGSHTTSPAQVVPLLQSLNRAEDLTSALLLRLDPILQHEPQVESTTPPTVRTVTVRLNNIGDGLQYLLDHIEL